MREISRVLVALELPPEGDALTPGSRRALEQARSLAPVLGAELVLLHSTAGGETWDGGRGHYVVAPDGLPARGRATLEGLSEALRGEGMGGELVVTEEPPWLAVVRRVLRGDIGLVVSGTRNQAQRDAGPIGSTAAKLLRKCPCPVWVAKPEGELAPRRILAATDLGPVGERVVEYAAFVADHYASELHLVHTIQVPLSAQFEDASEDFAAEERERATGVLRKQLEAAGYTAEVKFHVGVDAPTRAILRCDERIDPDLVVMGTVSRGGVAGLLLGNTAERLLERLDCSLLTVKPADFVCPVQPA